MSGFREYQSRPITRLAYKVPPGAVIKKVGEASHTISIGDELVTFKAYEPVSEGDYIVRRRTRHPYHRDAVEKSQGENHHAGAETDYDNDQEQDQDPWQAEKGIDETHQELVEPPADEAK